MFALQDHVPELRVFVDPLSAQTTISQFKSLVLLYLARCGTQKQHLGITPHIQYDALPLAVVIATETKVSIDEKEPRGDVFMKKFGKRARTI